MSSTTTNAASIDPATLQPQQSEAVCFSHIHLYVDRLENVNVYKDLEDRLNQFAGKVASSAVTPSLAEKQAIWKSISGNSDSSNENDNTVYQPQNRDVVKQLLAGFGFRVTGTCYPEEGSSNTRSVLVTSRDPRGVQILISAVDHDTSEATPHRYPYFDAKKINNFYAAHARRQGIGALAFRAPNVSSIFERYQSLHPTLVAGYHEFDEAKILEVFAYYKSHELDSLTKEPDTGTVLRFVQTSASTSVCPLPGLKTLDATFEDSSLAAYCDHWVSNVFDRTEFLDTLQDTLGFTPKVDFNAGVVAAGEAQIESTVTGNEFPIVPSNKAAALSDQSQVYLPINNALSSVGHVHGFLQELGQGVQHVASRVEDLVEFVQRANDYRCYTNEGFTFLRIPRSYYGILTVAQLTEGIDGDESGVGQSCAEKIFAALKAASFMTPDGALNLECEKEDIARILKHSLTDSVLSEYHTMQDTVLAVILRSRYRNVYSLLRDQVSETTYLGIVRNQILVDVQGEDLLYQIFTSNVLQREAGQEAPFFEFIQRVCSKSTDKHGDPVKIRPGCGGFGIRNFLTLFLSIEVSKAMNDVADAVATGNTKREAYARAMVESFTDQLNEANPILTFISDAMTEEGLCKEKLLDAIAENNSRQAKKWTTQMELVAERKKKGNEMLMECSARYNSLMRSLREAHINER
jgi:hypothetical protein